MIYIEASIVVTYFHDRLCHIFRYTYTGNNLSVIHVNASIFVTYFRDSLFHILHYTYEDISV